MFRSFRKSLRRTLSFRNRNKSRKNKADGGGTSQNWEGDAVNIKQQGGCNFSVKYLGCLEVSESRGTQVCSQAAHQMKMSSAGKKKQRVSLWVTEDTLRVTDDETKILVVDQVIEKVSFCTPDPHDEKLFSYICRDGTSRRWLCHSFKGIKESGERISHAVGCAFAACLAKKQQQNQQNQNFQRGNSTRKTLESRPNGVKLPQQSVDTLQKLNQEQYQARVDKATDDVNKSTPSTSSLPSNTETPAQSASPTSKQPPAAFARPRPSVGMDAAAFTRHASLPYRSKKSQGSATYQALTEDPLPPRIPASPEPLDDNLWLDNNTNQTNLQQQQQPNPFNSQPQPIMIQQQSGFTQAMVPPPEQQTVNPFANAGNTVNPFNEKFV